MQKSIFNKKQPEVKTTILALDVNAINCISGGNFTCYCANSGKSYFYTTDCTACSTACSDPIEGGVKSCTSNSSGLSGSIIAEIAIFSAVIVGVILGAMKDHNEFKLHKQKALDLAKVGGSRPLNDKIL